jgi:hypothetical protein
VDKVVSLRGSSNNVGVCVGEKKKKEKAWGLVLVQGREGTRIRGHHVGKSCELKEEKFGTH